MHHSRKAAAKLSKFYQYHFHSAKNCNGSAAATDPKLFNSAACQQIIYKLFISNDLQAGRQRTVRLCLWFMTPSETRRALEIIPLGINTYEWCFIISNTCLIDCGITRRDVKPATLLAAQGCMDCFWHPLNDSAPVADNINQFIN